MFRESFLYGGEIAEWGSPRNDILFAPEKCHIIRSKVFDKFSILEETLVILFAPTFRRKLGGELEIKGMDFHTIGNCLKEKYEKRVIVLNRFHHASSNKYFSNDDFIIDATDYIDVMELIIASDILITDYSSIMWDFSLTGKPVFLYQPDIKEYSQERGFYWPVEEWPYPRAETMGGLCDIIKNFDDEKYQKDLDTFFEKDQSFDDGHACERLAERIMDVIEHPDRYGKA